MSISKRAEDAIARAVTDPSSAEELKDAINAGANPQAASVSPLAAPPAAGTDAALIDAANAKIDELIAALKAAGLMA